jgi:hypothetical protein
MNSAPGILKFLAECYRENGSRIGVVSLASSRVRQSLIVEGEDAVVSRAVLEGQSFLPGKKAADLATQARLYEKECQLYYGSVFLVGPLEREESRAKPVFAPLILYSASVNSISDGSGAEFTINTGQRILNYALLECLGDDAFIERVEKCIDASTHTEGCVGELRRLLADYLPDASTEGLLSYPYLLKESELKEVLKQSETKRRGELILVPAAAFFLADRSTGMRGVLNDLRAMAAAPHDFSYPVQAIFAKDGEILPSQGCSPRGEIPALLSVAQKKITESARENPLTLAVGPPGTGKSFTIAALAMESMSRGESVLIVSKMDHAVDVVADKIEETLGLPGVCVRAGRKSYLKDLKRFLEDLLSGILIGEPIPKADLKASLARIRKGRSDGAKVERLLEKRGRNAVKRGALASRLEPGLLTRWRVALLRGQVLNEESLHVLAGRISDLFSRQVETTVEYLKLTRRDYLRKTLERNRKTFQAFSKGIRARSSHRQESYFEDVRWSKLLEALPVWLVNLSDLHRIIPLERGLFDLVIIDEASQCDIASVMPALQRARRAVITGDPKQLRHLSFLAGARQEEFARRFGVSEEDQERFHFRNVSLVDLVTDRIEDQNSIIFLNEHFRSRPGIIGFSNCEFYANRLAIMTGHREIDRREAPSLSVFRVAGKRKGNGVNEDEIEAILAQVESLIVPGAPPLTIGILSPFRAQVDAILKRVEKLPGLTEILERHDLLVGTAHSFQGEERDLMFLSFALDDESPSASFRFMEKDDVFNVSITRARLENRIFVSFEGNRSPHSLVARFLDYAETVGMGTVSPLKRVDPGTEPSLVEVVQALEALGIEVAAGFLIGGFEVDLLCRRNGRTIGIDLIGFPGPFSAAMSLDRHLMLQRAGIRLFPLSLLEWEMKRVEILAEIERCL